MSEKRLWREIRRLENLEVDLLVQRSAAEAGLRKLRLALWHAQQELAERRHELCMIQTDGCRRPLVPKQS